MHLLLPDVTMLLDDPAVGGGQAFTVLRTTRRHSLVNGDVQDTQTYKATGNVQPVGMYGLQQMEPEDKKNVTMVIRSTFAFQLGHQIKGGQVDPDKVLYNEKMYRVLQIEDWSQWGYTVAYITLDKGWSDGMV